jgi:hypothetical protein
VNLLIDLLDVLHEGMLHLLTSVLASFSATTTVATMLGIGGGAAMWYVSHVSHVSHQLRWSVDQHHHDTPVVGWPIR